MVTLFFSVQNIFIFYKDIVLVNPLSFQQESFFRCLLVIINDNITLDFMEWYFHLLKTFFYFDDFIMMLLPFNEWYSWSSLYVIFPSTLINCTDFST